MIVNDSIRKYYERETYNIIPPPLPENKFSGYSSIPRVWLSEYPDKDGKNGKPFMFNDEIEGQHYQFIMPYNKLWSLCISDERIKRKTIRRKIYNVWRQPAVFEKQEYFLINKKELLNAYNKYKEKEQKKRTREEAEQMQLTLF